MQRLGYALGQLLLNGEDVRDLTVVPLRPHMRVPVGIDELRHDADTIGGSTNAPLEDVTHRECLGDLTQRAVRAAKCRHGGSRGHLERRDLAQLCDDVLRHPVREVLVFAIIGQARKWQHRDTVLRRCGAIERARTRGGERPGEILRGHPRVYGFEKRPDRVETVFGIELQGPEDRLVHLV